MLSGVSLKNGRDLSSISELDLVDGNMAENWKRWKQKMELMLQGPLADKDKKQIFPFEISCTLL